MTSPSGPLETVYATDEDVAVRCGGDYVLLCPKWQKFAYQADGSFTAGAANGWILHSNLAHFTASQVGPGNVVWITGNTMNFKGSGELFGIDSSTDTSLTLHRIGMASGEGYPPGPLAGVNSLQYSILTYQPQIEKASFWLNQQYNIDPNTPGRMPSDIRDLRNLQDACVLTTIVRRLVAEVQDFRNGAWSAKLDNYRQDWAMVSERLQIRWGSSESAARPDTSIFSTRLVR